MDDLAQVLFLLRDLLIGLNKLFNQGGVVMCVQARFGQASDPVESVPGKQPTSATALCSRPNIRVSISAALQFEMSPNRANRHPLWDHSVYSIEEPPTLKVVSDLTPEGSLAGSLQGLLPGAPTDPDVHVKRIRFVTLWNRCPSHD